MQIFVGYGNLDLKPVKTPEGDFCMILVSDGLPDRNNVMYFAGESAVDYMISKLNELKELM